MTGIAAAKAGNREIAGRFLVVRQIGKGAFGVVHEVHDRERDALVALKELTRLDADSLYRFKNEFRSLADVSHRNLVTLHELLVSDGNWYLTMELVDGVDFLTHTGGPGPRGDAPTVGMSAAADANAASAAGPARRPPDLERLRSSVRQLAEGVMALHQAGKLHRDLKPSNVLVTHAGRVVILDFGLVTDVASVAMDSSREEYLIGTPAYLSPEQMWDAPASQASDWYAVGVMLYEALAGRPPFVGSLAEIVAAKVKAEPVDPRRLSPKLPGDLCDLCMRLLRREPGERATASEVREVLGIRPEPRSAQDARPSRLDDAQLFGREPHRAALRDAFEAARRGGTVVARVHGASGMGKTALVSSFLGGLVRSEPVVVIEGRCFERESMPYRALDDLVDGLTTHLLAAPPSEAARLLPDDVDALARLFPVLRRVTAVTSAPRAIGEPRELRRRAVAALRELLRRMSERRTVVLHVDDLQWGDLDSAALLDDLLRAPDPPPLLFIASHRTEDAGKIAPIQALRRLAADDVREIVVGPMEPGEGRRLAEALLAREGLAADAEVIARESGGSPFFVLELVLHLKVGAGLEEAGPISLTQMLAERIERLPPVARRLLETVVTAARPIEWGVVAEAAGSLPNDVAQEGLAVLRTQRFVRASGSRRSDTLETFHDRVRDSVSRALTPEAARERHAHLGAALERAESPDPEALALHFAMAGDTARARRYAEIAARRAAEALAFDRAAALFQDALVLTSDAAAARGLRAELGAALANAGRGPEAAKAYLAAVDESSPAAAFDLQRRAAEQLLRSGHMDEGRAVLGAVLAPVGLRLPATPRKAVRSLLIQRAKLRLRGLRFVPRAEADIPPALLERADACWAVSIGLAGVDVVRGAEFQTRYLRLALAAGDPYRIARGFALESMSSACESGPAGERARVLCAEADTLAAGLGRPHARGMVAMAKGYIAYADGRWATCTREFERAIAIFREHCSGTAWEIAFSQVFALAGLWYRGELEEMRRRAPMWWTDARGRGDLYAATSFGTRFMPKLSLAADDPDTAMRTTREAIAQWGQSGWAVPHCFAQFAEAEVSLYAGDAGAAWECIEATWRELETSLLFRAAPLLSIGRYLHGQCALAASTAGRPDLVALAERDVAAFEAENAPLPRASASLLRAGICARRGDPAEAAALFAVAERQLGALGMALFAAGAKRRRGALLGGEAGRALVAEADVTLVERGVKNVERMAAMLVA